MTEEELIDYEARTAEEQHHKKKKRDYITEVNSGIYTVLAITYDVTVFEGNARRFIHDVNCSNPAVPGANRTCLLGSTSNGTFCSATNGTQGFLTCLCWDTTCIGNATGWTGVNGGSIPNNITLTLGTRHFGYKNNISYTGGVQLELQEVTHQIRGPQGFWSLNLTTCAWTRLTWINATWTNAGNQQQCVPVIQSKYLTLTAEENLILPAPPVYPDPRPHPTVVVPVDCTIDGNLYPSCLDGNLNSTYCYCYVQSSQFFSIWEIITLRAVDTPPYVTFKYTAQGNATLYSLSNQGVFRIVDGNNVAWGDGTETDFKKWTPAYNYFCMIADPFFSFYVNWGSYAYPNDPFPDPLNFTYELSPFSCAHNTWPYADQIYSWQRGENWCRGCEYNLTSNGAPAIPASWSPVDWNAFNIAFNNSDVVPSRLFNQAFAKQLCRITYVPTGSDNGLSKPLGQIFVALTTRGLMPTRFTAGNEGRTGAADASTI